jgi:hypothetical protein
LATLYTVQGSAIGFQHTTTMRSFSAFLAATIAALASLFLDTRAAPVGICVSELKVCCVPKIDLRFREDFGDLAGSTHDIGALECVLHNE